MDGFQLSTLTKGIGAACAIALAQAGAALCLVLREPQGDAPPNLATVDSIRQLGATAEVVHCDLNNLDSVRGVFQKALDAMGGRIDVLVNCAGIQRRSPSLDFLETDWDDVRARYAPHPVLYFSYYDHALSYFTSRPLHLSNSIPLGVGRQPQVRLAPFSGSRPSHGAKTAGKDHKLLFPPHLPRWYHSSCLRRGQGRPRATHKSPE